MPIIAVIDDDRDIVDATTFLLEAQGYKTCSACSVEDGLNLVHSKNPDVLLLDIMLDEGNDGLFLAEQLYRGGWRMPVILMSSLPPEIGQEFTVRTDIPVQGFLEKPVPSGVLLNTVRHAVARGAQSQAEEDR